MNKPSERPADQKAIKEISIADIERAFAAAISSLTNGREASVNISTFDIGQGISFIGRENIKMQVTLNIAGVPTNGDDDIPF